ncbi:SIS domain-containing protein [Alicyclobacillus cycloheptanicus]|uniref:Phosphosugar-binding protein n=1 Tax=Alicyclobacillus cycloheptanicus TaxID=1457 RepID=A0ABT9XHR1_9BACL|nr:SIS domain-containing protein [Alicyclobacillus cycloheptanicus]MDQ0189849.1 putative phosphosugar-binding protein [Alicyclobacillus cycloheptanicus]
MVSAESFFASVDDALTKVKTTQLPAIKRVAGRLANRIRIGGVVHLFGTGHSRVFAMEMCNRAGGLVPMHMISTDDLQRRGVRAASDLEDPSLERDPQVAHELLACCDIQPADAAIIVSHSGRNGALVEFALLLKDRGIPVIGVTSMSHTLSVASRHPSGKRLFEVADDVIDNCGPVGDAMLYDERLGTKVCPISSVTGAVIAQCLTAEITRNLLEWGVSVPVLKSSNLDGADAWNETVRLTTDDRRRE